MRTPSAAHPPPAHPPASSSHRGFIPLLPVLSVAQTTELLSHNTNAIALIKVACKIHFTESYSQFSFILLLDLQMTFEAVDHILFLETPSVIAYRRSYVLLIKRRIKPDCFNNAERELLGRIFSNSYSEFKFLIMRHKHLFRTKCIKT